MTGNFSYLHIYTFVSIQTDIMCYYILTFSSMIMKGVIYIILVPIFSPGPVPITRGLDVSGWCHACFVPWQNAWRLAVRRPRTHTVHV